jgi:hypothetical protein
MPAPSPNVYLRATCFEADELLDLSSGQAAPALLLQAGLHLDACEGCRLALAELTRPMTPGPTRLNVATGRPTTGLRTFWPGEVVAGRFRVIQLLGRGGMGEVYEVEDLLLATTLALKTLTIEAQLDQAAIARIKREASLARRVTHPNVCRIFDLLLHEELPKQSSGHPARAGGPAVLPVLTMELLPGQPLRAAVAKAPLERTLALALAAQIAAGLDAAHAAGVIHRDFKSDNIMLVPEPAGPRAVITDFGLARLSGAGASISGLNPAGTLGYMSPEQLQGQAATAASDLFAFAVVLFEMLTGQRPFDGDSPAAIMNRTLSAAPPSLGGLLPEAPPAWDSIFAQALAKDPRRRPGTAGDLVRALAGPPEVHRRTFTRRGVLASLGVLGGGATVAALGWRRHADAPAEAIPVRQTPPLTATPVGAPIAVPVPAAAPAAVPAPLPVPTPLAPRRTSQRRRKAPAPAEPSSATSPQSVPHAEDLIDPFASP